MANMKLVNEVLDWLIAHPDQHYQGAFVSFNDDVVYGRQDVDTTNWCGTTFCFGGAALMLRNKLTIRYDNFGVYAVAVSLNKTYSEGLSMGTAARLLLDLSFREAAIILYDTAGMNWTPELFKEFVLEVLTWDDDAFARWDNGGLERLTMSHQI